MCAARKQVQNPVKHYCYTHVRIFYFNVNDNRNLASIIVEIKISQFDVLWKWGHDANKYNKVDKSTGWQCEYRLDFLAFLKNTIRAYLNFLTVSDNRLMWLLEYLNFIQCKYGIAKADGLNVAWYVRRKHRALS